MRPILFVYLNEEKIAMSDFTQEIEGEALLHWWMERCNMTREEVINSMIEHNQDMSFLQEEK